MLQAIAVSNSEHLRPLMPIDSGHRFIDAILSAIAAEALEQFDSDWSLKDLQQRIDLFKMRMAIGSCCEAI